MAKSLLGVALPVTSTSQTQSSDDDSDSLDKVPNGEFVQLFTKSQRRLFLFILAQIGSANDAEDVLQETNVIIWSKFHQFQPGTSFFAWAGKIASYEILKYRDRLRTANRIKFSDEFLTLVAAEAIEISDELELRRDALSDCLRGLKAVDRELIQARYSPGENGLKVAEQIGRPANSVYQSVGRIRKVLFDCVTRRLAATTRATT